METPQFLWATYSNVQHPLQKKKKSVLLCSNNFLGFNLCLLPLALTGHPGEESGSVFLTPSSHQILITLARPPCTRSLPI